MKKRVIGVDEAGKGPVIGPLVVCGFATTAERIEDLLKLGVKDSKRLSRKRREKIANFLLKHGDSEVIVIQPSELDKMMSEKTINEILCECYERIVDRFKPGTFFVDSFDVKPERLEKRLKRKGAEVVAEHGADEKYPVVAAASIIAKVRRDEEIEKLRRIYGDFGSGYASDERTREFLRSYLEKNGCFPPCARKSWKTLEKISQKSLNDFSDISF
jgi:ribonuclease HII